MLVLLGACDKNEQEIVQLQNPDPNATVTSVLPQRGMVGTLVTINGTNFGASKELVKVYFKGVENEVPLIKCEDKELQVTVPEGAQTGPLTLTVMEQTIVTDVEFQVIPDPEITSISIQQGYAADELKIIGNNFGTTIEDIKLYSVIDDEEVVFEVTACTDTEITAKVPTVTTFGEFQINLSILGRSASNVLNFEFLEQAAITSVKSNNVLSEQFAFEGDEITISGTGFGDSSEEVEVLMGTVEATVTSCTNTEIKATVPAGFTGGKVSVTRNERTAESTTEFQILTANTDISEYVLKNYKQPFTYIPLTTDQDAGEGKNSWAEPTDWTVNDAVKNMYNSPSSGQYCSESTGGLNISADGNYLAMQAGWSNNNIEATKSVSNGKIYQTLNLPKGNYQFNVKLKEVVHKSGCSMNIVVNEGMDLPNTESLLGDITYKSFTNNNDLSLDFSLNVTSQISIGFVANLVNTTCFKVKEIQLIYLGNN